MLFWTCSFIVSLNQSTFIMDGLCLLAGLGEWWVKPLHGINLLREYSDKFGWHVDKDTPRTCTKSFSKDGPLLKQYYPLSSQLWQCFHCSWWIEPPITDKVGRLVHSQGDFMKFLLHASSWQYSNVLYCSLVFKRCCICPPQLAYFHAPYWCEGTEKGACVCVCLQSEWHSRYSN